MLSGLNVQGLKIQESSVQGHFVTGTKKYSTGIKWYRDVLSQRSKVRG
jgi:hypothetical protein